MNAYHIERRGKPTGRWPEYVLVADGISLGRVRRVLTSGGDRMSPHARHDGWHIHGIVCETRESAETALIARAVASGRLKGTPMQSLIFTLTFKLGPTVIAKVVGRPIKPERLTMEVIQEVIHMEQRLEQMTGLRVHIESGYADER